MPLNVSNSAPQTRVKLIQTVARNLSKGYRQTASASIMLTGDPGIGKTSFIEQFCELAGLARILIEVPHIVEEHLVNVPFIVFDGAGNQTKKSALQFDPKQYNVVLARSNLHAQIVATKQMPEKTLLNHIYNNPNKNLALMHEALGGTKDTLPKIIAEIRNMYKCILFIDEFFRKTSGQIRNVLRNILNGDIGLDKMPDDCAAIYATNLKDDGIDKIPANFQFRYVDMKAPTKEEWFKYLISKFHQDQTVSLNMEVIEQFHKMMDDAMVSHDFEDELGSQVRTSPRRWEQILLYINSSLPAKDDNDASHLLRSVQSMFTDYKTDKQSDLWPLVEKVLRKLIASTSNIDQSVQMAEKTDWRGTIEHQIEQKKKLGKHRSYIPVLSGPPGIGKTGDAARIAKDEGLLLITINCGGMPVDDVIGMPIPKSGEGEHLDVHFSKPKLFIQIDNKIKAAEEAYRASPDYDPAFEKARWKYLLFFDELNRTKSVNTFNALRKLILDKQFNENEKLPDESIVLAAINPEDEGALDLTSHMRDVMDLMGTQPTWKAFESFIDKQKAPKNVKDAVMGIIESFADTFDVKKSDTIPKDAKRFYLAITDDHNDQPMFVSPRQYAAIYAELVTSLNDLVADNDINADTLQDTDFANEMIGEANDLIVDAFKGVLMNGFQASERSPDRFFQTMENVWAPTVNPIKKLVTVKVDTRPTFAQIAQQYFHDTGMSLVDSMELKGYFGSTNVVDYNKDLLNFLQSKYASAKDIMKHFLQTPAKRKKLRGLDLDELDEEVSMLEHFMRDVTHALKLQNIANDFIEITKETFVEFYGQLYDAIEQLFDDIAEKEGEDAAHEWREKGMQIISDINDFLYGDEI